MSPYPERLGAHRSGASLPGIGFSGPDPDASIPPQWMSQPHLQMTPMSGKSKRNGKGGCEAKKWHYSLLVIGKSSGRPEARNTDIEFLKTSLELICAKFKTEAAGAFDRIESIEGKTVRSHWRITQTMIVPWGLWVDSKCSGTLEEWEENNNSNNDYGSSGWALLICLTALEAFACSVQAIKSPGLLGFKSSFLNIYHMCDLRKVSSFSTLIH